MSSKPPGATAIATPADVLTAWFGTDPNAIDERWFKASTAFDETLRVRFAATVELALQGGLTEWEASLEGRRALLIVLDQFTRNLYRHTARAFAGDVRALALTQAMLARGDDRLLTVVQRWFVYLPLMHAEDAAAQALSVHLYATLAEEDPRLASALDYARRHREVVDRFGRFPHRNEALGRPTPAAEATFLLQPGSRF